MRNTICSTVRVKVSLYKEQKYEMQSRHLIFRNKSHHPPCDQMSTQVLYLCFIFQDTHNYKDCNQWPADHQHTNTVCVCVFTWIIRRHPFIILIQRPNSATIWFIPSHTSGVELPCMVLVWALGAISWGSMFCPRTLWQMDKPVSPVVTGPPTSWTTAASFNFFPLISFQDENGRRWFHSGHSHSVQITSVMLYWHDGFWKRYSQSTKILLTAEQYKHDDVEKIKWNSFYINMFD